MGKQKIELNAGQAIFGYKELAEQLNISTGTVHSYIKLLEDEKIIENKSSNKGTVVTILNWSKYQVTESGLNEEKKQTERRLNQTKKDKNVKNNLSKDKLVNTSYGSEQVEMVLNLYQKHTGNLPADKFPRRIAQNIVQITTTLIKDIRPHYNSARIGELTLEFILNKAFEWYFGQLKDDVEVTKLDTVKLNIKSRFYEATRRKYVPNYKFTPKS